MPAFVFCLLATACSEEKSTPPKPSSRPVTTATAQAGEAKTSHIFSGKAKSPQSTDLSFRVPGQIVRLPVRAGTRLEKDDLVAQLDKDDYQLEANQARARVLSILAKKERLGKDYKRMQKLLKEEAISQSRFDEVKSSYNSTSADLEAAREQLRLAVRNLGYTRITAPEAGVVSRVAVEKFQNVEAGQPIATFLSGNGTEVEVGIPDKLIHFLAPGKPARVEFNALPDRAFKARVTEIGMQPNPESTYPVTLVLDSPSPRIRPGMAALAEFDFPDAGSSAIYIPLSAIVREPFGSKYVWLVDPENMQVEKREVEIGAIREDKVQILSGINEGQTIVIRGAHRLNPGEKINPIEAEGL
ncbi:MAG: efflux RND transporter periplasmic adaptor subunit [Desulfonatronovibrionaceae bacterium]